MLFNILLVHTEMEPVTPQVNVTAKEEPPVVIVQLGKIQDYQVNQKFLILLNKYQISWKTSTWKTNLKYLKNVTNVTVTFWLSRYFNLTGHSTVKTSPV